MDWGSFFSSLGIDVGAQLISSVTAALVIGAIGLNLHFGYTGLMNFGQAGFMLIGAYGFAITARFTGNFWLAALIGLASAAAFAALLGIPTLKLRGDYLGIVTIAAAEIVRLVGDNQTLAPWTGGAAGLAGSLYQGPFVDLSPFPAEGTFTIGPYHYPFSAGDSWWLRIVAWGLVAVIAVITFLLVRSPWGRVLRGIREDEDAARSLGKNVFLYKIQSLMLGGVIAGAGGIVWVLAQSVQADSLGRTTTFLLFTCLLLGGAATVFGPILGTLLYAVIITALQDIVTQVVPSSILSSTQVPQFTWVVIGAGLMVLVIFRPQGILGNKKELSFGD